MIWKYWGSSLSVDASLWLIHVATVTWNGQTAECQLGFCLGHQKHDVGVHFEANIQLGFDRPRSVSNAGGRGGHWGAPISPRSCQICRVWKNEASRHPYMFRVEELERERQWERARDVYQKTDGCSKRRKCEFYSQLGGSCWFCKATYQTYFSK